MANIAKDLAQIISQSNSKKTGPYDTPAKVKRIEGNTVWVSIPGGIDETPIEKTVNCSVGDNVQVRVSGGRAWITGNATAPPTDDTTAIKADTTANKAQVIAVDAKETAEAVEGIATTAKTIAEGVNEHFWYDNTGAHVTEVTQEEWNDISDPNYHSGGNTLITTQGMAIRNGLDNLAQFGATGAVIGEISNGNSRTEVSTSGMQIYQRVSGNDVPIANLGYGPGKDSGGSTSDEPYYTIGTRYPGSDIGNYSAVLGERNEASAYTSHASGFACHATNLQAHAEGLRTSATGQQSHSEGADTTASNTCSHAEGDNTTASGVNSHAEGRDTVASGWFSHTSGQGTVADQNRQTAIGAYNTKNNTNNLFVVGNGTADNARSNAFEVEWSGDVTTAGDVTDGSGNVLSNKIESSYLAVSSTSIYSSQSISGSGYVSAASHSLTPPDNVHTWKALSVAGWYLNQHNVRFSTCYIDGDASVFCGLHNDSTSTLSVNLTIYVLWVRTA